jgi:hypothetical protein
MSKILRNIDTPFLGANVQVGASNETGKKAKLKMNDKKIHSLQELRDNFDPEVIVKKYKNGKLELWLTQHYYYTEVTAVSKIDRNSKKLLPELCLALGVEYSPMNYISDEEKTALENRKEMVAKLTSDEKILKNIFIVATNQSELAELLDNGEDMIYLCNNTFSIPITVDNKKYIGIGDVTIENAFTKTQYERAGIEIENITLPQEANPETIEIARTAAAQHGYDDFADCHSKLASTYHNLLKTNPLISCHRLPYDTSVAGKFYNSHSACYNASKNVIKKAHDTANSYFDPESKQSLAKECAKYYNHIINDAFHEKMSELEELCVKTNNEAAFSKISKLVNKSKEKLKKIYDKELIEEHEFYKMYNMDYFVEQLDIDEMDTSFSDEEDVLGRILETIFTNTKEYSVTNIFSSISEMESDLRDNATTFYKFAQSEYQQYIAKIEAQLEIVGAAVESDT